MLNWKPCDHNWLATTRIIGKQTSQLIGFAWWNGYIHKSTVSAITWVGNQYFSQQPCPYIWTYTHIPINLDILMARTETVVPQFPNALILLCVIKKLKKHIIHNLDCIILWIFQRLLILFRWHDTISSALPLYSNQPQLVSVPSQ